MKVLSLLMLLSLLSSTPAFSAMSSQRQDSRKQEDNCVWTVQGELKDDDYRMNESGAPYDLIHFYAQQGDRPYLRLESTAFKPSVSLFKVTETGYEHIETDTMPYEKTSFIWPWIYENSNYAVRVTPNMRRNPGDDESLDSQWPQRGYYTLQISPFSCNA